MNLNYIKYVFGLVGLSLSFFAIAQEDAAQLNNVEEVVVVGSQIKGAKITGALPVTVLSADDIDAIGALDGDELVNNLTEQGMNFFNEQEEISGGVNAARGDVGAYNLRGLGVGNTLVLLNGRRLVNNAGYQTELIGGDYVPTMTVNSNLIPTNALDRLEVLKDGASAIYGADAVAGVVNNVLQTNYEGLRVNAKITGYDHFKAQDTDFKVKWGKFFNEGRTNVNVSFSHRDRESISLLEDEKWADMDFRRLIPAGSVWANDASFRNQYTYGMMQLDSTGKFSFSDSAGETQLFPSSRPECSNSGAIATGFGSCLVPDTNYYYNPSDAGRQYRGDMQRDNLFVFINHELENGNELFAEIGQYRSNSSKFDNNGSFTAGIVSLPADYYWFSQLPSAAQGIANGKAVRIDGWRPINHPRNTKVDKEDYRYLIGLRGVTDSNWSWESAYLTTKAKSEDATSGRVVYNKFVESVNDNSAAAYNIFDLNPLTNNFASISDTVRRSDTSSLWSIDYKASNPEVFQLPAGPVAVLFGAEYREEKYRDDRDKYLDGTVVLAGPGTSSSATNTFPYRSNVMGSSATNDTSGSKSVKSVFVEMQAPVTDSINAQVALRHEAFSDSDSATVGKLAFGYDVNDWLKLRASTSTAFRAPNLVQVNQKEVARTGAVNDWLMQYVRIENGLSVLTSGDMDGNFTALRYAEGAVGLKPEESTNHSIGFVLTPTQIEGLTITVDAWSIEKENTIALFGRNNLSAADLLARIRGGADCSAGDPAVQRLSADTLDADEQALFTNLGLCPVGKIEVANDNYQNLATRELEGTDIAVYYDFETSVGEFEITLITSLTDKFYQEPTGDYTALAVAQASGELPAFAAVTGFGDILGTELGAIERKDRLQVSFRRGDWRSSLTALRIGSFVDSGETSAGFPWPIPSMTTADFSLSKSFDIGGNKARAKLTVKNIADERAPLADGYNGFMSDAHSDMGRYFYLDLRVDF